MLPYSRFNVAVGAVGPAAEMPAADSQRRTGSNSKSSQGQSKSAYRALQRGRGRSTGEGPRSGPGRNTGHRPKPAIRPFYDDLTDVVDLTELSEIVKKCSQKWSEGGDVGTIVAAFGKAAKVCTWAELALPLLPSANPQARVCLYPYRLWVGTCLQKGRRDTNCQNCFSAPAGRPFESNFGPFDLLFNCKGIR